MIEGYLAPSWPTLSVAGPDAVSWLQGVLTADINAVGRGHAVHSLLLTKLGKIRAELVVLGQGASAEHGDQLFLGVIGGEPSDILTELEAHLVMEDAEVALAPSAEWIIVPRALLRPGAEGDIAGVKEVLEAAGVLVAPHPAAPSELVLLFSDGEAAWQALHGFLRAAGAFAAPAEAWSRARVELGIPGFGVDFGPGDNPHQASLERRAVAFGKGCYLGQEVVYMQDARGKVKRRLVRLEHPGSLPSGAEIVGSGEDSARVLGVVTTSGIGRSIARLEAPFYEPGSLVRVGIGPEQAVEARVVPLAPAPGA